ncbi:hypothetical protein OG889_21325 [Streptomyces sp. NBC_00481]|uniref:hypothetical protein n=1 Tax=unclassified Streptomyces TaxID=2593676 RepID=UPI002DD86848|nr:MULTISPECIES: hypothetical protein [unclassified Streptomyces]WRY97049.1 hypothetical protein OG889_21325 [Streptomyces sp. NBC_00481]
MRGRTHARTSTAASITAAIVALGALQGSAADTQNVELTSTPSKTCHGTRPTGSLTDPTGEGIPEETPADRTLGYVDNLTTGRHSAVFTGLVLDEDAKAIDIYRIPSAPFDTAVCATAEKGVTVRFHDRDINEKDLTALLDLITEDMNRWDGTFNLREAGLDGTGYIEIGVDDPDTAEPILREALGERSAKYLRVEFAPQAYLL